MAYYNSRITLADVDGRLQSCGESLALPDGYKLFHSSVYEWRKVGVMRVQNGAIYGDTNGTKKEVYEALSSNSNLPEQWAERAWVDAIHRAENDKQKTVNGGGFTVRITPKYFFVSYSGKHKTSKRFTRDAVLWDIARFIVYHQR